jgi:hypothetical protein
MYHGFFCFAAAGIIINWVYIIVMAYPIAKALPRDSTTGITNSGIGLLADLRVFLISLLFLLVLPVLWVLMGKAFGVSRVTIHLYNSVKSPLYEMIFNSISDMTGNTLFADLPNNKKVQFIMDKIKQIQALPFGLKTVLFLIIKFLPFGEITELCLKYGNDSAEFKKELMNLIDESINERLSPPWLLFLLLLFFNTALFIAIWFLV